MRSRMLLFAATCSLLAACGRAAPTTTTPVTTNPDGEHATLVATLDGDSIVVALKGGGEAEVRLLGINAPEGDECHGDAAREALDALLEGGDLILEAGGDDDMDRYGRLLRYISVDGELVNALLLTDGHALALRNGHPLQDEFMALDDAAYQARAGMWATDACGPASTATLRITSIEWDPPGADEENATEEWVDVGNDGALTADLEGWILRDESSQHRYVFPPGTTLDPGDTLRVRSGCGDDAIGDLSWCAGPVWSNTGDTAILQDLHGNVVDRLRYAGRP